MDDGGIDEPDGPGRPPGGWQPPGQAPLPPAPDRPVSTVRRLIGSAAWILGIVGLLVLARGYALLSGSQGSAAEQWGRAVGAIVGAIVIGVIGRWLVVRVRRRGRLASPWVLGVAALVLVGSIVGQPRLGASDTTAPAIDAYFRIGSPFSLATPTADEVTQFGTDLAETTSGVYDIRRVLQDGKVIGYEVVADLDSEASPDFRQGLIQGWLDGGDGVEAHESTIRDTPVVVGTRPSGVAVMWVEPPYVLYVYAVDIDSGQKVAAAIMAAYK
jgi:hypothetical protein